MDVTSPDVPQPLSPSHVMHHTSKHACIPCDAAPHGVPCTNVHAIRGDGSSGTRRKRISYEQPCHAMPPPHIMHACWFSPATDIRAIVASSSHRFCTVNRVFACIHRVVADIRFVLSAVDCHVFWQKEIFHFGLDRRTYANSWS